MTTTNTATLGGHRVTSTGEHYGVQGQAVATWHCIDCDTVASRTSFTAGLAGCPARPESLDYVRVCGTSCTGHPDTDSPEYRAWLESKTLRFSSVPRFFCKAEDLGKRAAAQYAHYAERIGLPLANWVERTPILDDGGVCAAFRFKEAYYAVHVNAYGHISVQRTDV